MSAHQRYMQYRKDELYHFNPNHDPKTGDLLLLIFIRQCQMLKNTLQMLKL